MKTISSFAIALLLTGPLETVARAEEPTSMPTPIRDSLAAARTSLRAEAPAPVPRTSAKGGFIGAVVGATAAAGVTYWAAKSYGENPPGGFCGGCFVAWGAWAIPAGALIGGVTGALIAGSTAARPVPAARETFVVPVAGRRAAGVVLTVRY